MEVPLPGALVSSILPWWYCTACFTMERPSPVPPEDLEWLLYNLKKRSNMRIRYSGAMPIHVSETVTEEKPPSLTVLIFTLPPCLLYFMALSQRLYTISYSSLFTPYTLAGEPSTAMLIRWPSADRSRSSATPAATESRWMFLRGISPPSSSWERRFF